MDWQSLAVIGTVAGAALYLIVAYIRSKRKKSCCAECGLHRQLTKR
jgi:hypothetical protein